MLIELRVKDLGVIEEASLVLGPGLTALTGETGAGKTMIVTAIGLLLGDRADALLVRPGAAQARVDGRFVEGDVETVLSRVVPSEGRSRAYINGVPVTVAHLAETGRAFVELHGQHDHQSLLNGAGQRHALDAFGDVDAGPVRQARERVRAIDSAMAALGGDERAQAREADLLRYQVNEIEAAAITDVDEDAALEREEDVLSDAVAHREAADGVASLLGGDDGARDLIGTALTALSSRAPFADVAARLKALSAELDDVTDDVRTRLEGLEPDPERLEEIRRRRALLRDLCRKYGDRFDAVVAFADEARARLVELDSVQERAAALAAERSAALREWAAAAKRRRDEREAAAMRLGPAIQARLGALALGRAQLRIDVRDAPASSDGAARQVPDDGSDVQFVFSAHAGAPMSPLSKVASGGELARVMLAARLALAERPGGDVLGPVTLVFDEVDAGVGGSAALAVGGALSEVAQGRQVLVVTHLAQVAAHADRQITVVKREGATTTSTELVAVDDEDRVTELARMLSGQPDLASARSHARELIGSAVAGRVARQDPGSKAPKPARKTGARRQLS